MADLRALSEGATPGPWVHTEAGSVEAKRHLGGLHVTSFDGGDTDAEFVVALVNAYRSGRLIDAQAGRVAEAGLRAEMEALADEWQERRELSNNEYVANTIGARLKELRSVLDAQPGPDLRALLDAAIGVGAVSAADADRFRSLAAALDARRLVPSLASLMADFDRWAANAPEMSTGRSIVDDDERRGGTPEL